MSALKGSAQVGDTVWLRLKNGTWRRDWQVIEVGIQNAHGYPLNSRVTRGKSRRVIEAFDRQHVCVLPHTLPDVVAAYAKKYPHLVVTRLVTGGERERYRLVCGKCMEDVGLYRTEWQYGDATLDVRDGVVMCITDADNIVDSTEGLRCGCKRKRTYALPYEVD